MPKQQILSSLSLILAISLISACSTTSTPPSTQPEDINRSGVTQSDKARDVPSAIAAENAGDFEKAAQLYLNAADSAPTEISYSYQLKAIALLIKGNFIDQAALVTDRVDHQALLLPQQTRLALYVGQIALAQQNPERALHSLNTVNLNTLTHDERKLFLQLKAEAHSQRQEPEAVFLALYQLLALTDAIADREALENRIWTILTQLPPKSLEDLRSQANSSDVESWLDLVNIYHNHSTLSSRLDIQIEAWQAQYPGHSASSQLLKSIQALQNNILFKPHVIALLLPEDGPFADAAAAIKTGFIAAYMGLDDASYQPEIRFYNSSELTEQSLATYDRAVNEGADLIVGPLSKNNVAALAGRESLAVPTLALNSVNLDAPIENLYLFGLNPEDEAQQVAEKAWLDGFNQALVLTPENNLGERLGTAFEEKWAAFGGKTIERQSFKPTEQDFSKPLQALLNLDESQSRIRAIKQLLGRDINTEPRRRQDVDFIYLSAQPPQARQIRPQLKFFYAGNIPIYATSHLYTGTPNPSTDHDLNDILFCDMPWALEANPLWEKIQQHWPSQAPNYKRLYALGVDSFNIIAHLRRLSAYKFQQFPGQTGLLSLDGLQQVQRQLLWARFVNGKPVHIKDQHAL